MRPVLKRYLISGGIGLLLFALVIINHGFFAAETLKDKLRILADACTIPGMVILMFGLLMKVSTTGVFNGLGYAMKNIARVFIPGIALRQQHMTYYDYVKEKEEKRAKNRGGFGFLVITGAGFLVFAVIFIIIYYQI